MMKQAFRVLPVVCLLATVQGDYSCVCTGGVYNGTALTGNSQATCDQALNIQLTPAQRTNCTTSKAALEAMSGYQEIHDNCCNNGAGTGGCSSDTGATCNLNGCDAARNAACLSQDPIVIGGVTLPATKKCICSGGTCACHGNCIAQNATCVSPATSPQDTCDSNTGGLCATDGCDASRNAVCGGPRSGFKCICPDGTCNCRGTCVAAGACEELTCEQDTGGTCKVSSCKAERNAQCTDHKCMCGPGLCNCNGACQATELDCTPSDANQVKTLLGLCMVMAVLLF